MRSANNDNAPECRIPVYLKTIEQLAYRLRRAIEQLPRNRLPLSMSCFPSGACGDTSLILGAYLVDNGFDGFRYVSGERGSHEAGTWTSHAWIANGDLIVDITADQFADAPAGVIVMASSPWHETFSSLDSASVDFREYSGPSIHDLHALYANLRQSIFGPT